MEIKIWWTLFIQTSNWSDLGFCQNCIEKHFCFSLKFFLFHQMAKTFSVRCMLESWLNNESFLITFWIFHLWVVLCCMEWRLHPSWKEDYPNISGRKTILTQLLWIFQKSYSLFTLEALNTAFSKINIWGVCLEIGPEAGSVYILKKQISWIN